MRRSAIAHSKFIGALLAGALFSAAVSVGTAGAPTGDACSLLTADSVSSAVGRKFDNGHRTNQSGNEKSASRMTTCTWDAQRSGASTTAAQMMRDQISVNLVLWSWPTPKRSADYIESFRKLAKETGEPAPKPIALGDEAIVDGTSVHVRKGAASFTVTVQVLGDADPRAAAKAAETLARQVVATL